MNTLTKYWFLEGFNLLNKLGMQKMMQLCKILEMENFDKGTLIPLENRSKKCIVFLKKGSVKITDSRSQNVKYIVKKGNIFGELALYSEKSQEEAYALEDCIICYIEADTMTELMEKHKSLKNGVLKIYGLRIKKLEHRLEDLLYKDSETRIADFIAYYVSEFGKEKDTTLIAKNLLTHKDIANLTNTSRQTVNNIMGKMRKEGLIDYDSKHISMPKQMVVQ